MTDITARCEITSDEDSEFGARRDAGCDQPTKTSWKKMVDRIWVFTEATAGTDTRQFRGLL